MKVTISAESKRVVTMEEMKMAKEIVQAMKEDELTAAEYARIAVVAFGDGCEKVYEATAEIAKNCRAWDNYEEGSGTLDIWIEATARTWNGFVEIGAYLTDIWNISGDNDQTEHMFIQRFERVK